MVLINLLNKNRVSFKKRLLIYLTHYGFQSFFLIGMKIRCAGRGFQNRSRRSKKSTQMLKTNSATTFINLIDFTNAIIFSKQGIQSIHV
jgi:hypothetical protein